jgi:23S rRNA pseudouridine2457 synthase
VDFLAAKRYLLFHKPYNVLSQFTDRDRSLQASRQTLGDYIAIPDIYPVGRLDQDSEGLMLLTNDGELQHRLSHPRFQHPRTYWVQVERIPDLSALDHLRQGVTIQDYHTRPSIVEFLVPEPDLPARTPPIRFRKSIPTAWLAITLTEGRNRQVRRMTAAVGFPTLRLMRVSIGPLQLQDLAPGQYRDLTLEELQRLLKLCHLPMRGLVSIKGRSSDSQR